MLTRCEVDVRSGAIAEVMEDLGSVSPEFRAIWPQFDKINLPDLFFISAGTSTYMLVMRTVFEAAKRKLCYDDFIKKCNPHFSR